MEGKNLGEESPRCAMRTPPPDPQLWERGKLWGRRRRDVPKVEKTSKVDPGDCV